jgi:hypothetical protein
MDSALLVVSDRESLAWMLSQQRFAIPGGRKLNAPKAGTRLLLYTTRSCYRNPTRDRGLVMGLATVAHDATVLDTPVTFREREFGLGFELVIEGIAPPHDGVELATYAGRLDALPDPATWSVRMRRSLVPLSKRDTALLERELRRRLRPLGEVLDAYRAACKVT